MIKTTRFLNSVSQGVEPEGFPLLLQSLKTDSPVKDMHSNPNKQLYGGKTSQAAHVGLNVESFVVNSCVRAQTSWNVRWAPMFSSW